MSQRTRDIDDRLALSTELTETERHRLLESARRRHVLDVLAGREESMSLSDLAAAVVERERGDPSHVDDVATTLHHVHLPKLADAGALEYDPSVNRVTP